MKTSFAITDTSKINSSKVTKFVSISHFCGKKGNIRHRCFKLEYYLNKLIQSGKDFNMKNTNNVQRQIWKPKRDTTRYVAHTSLLATSHDQWYFDSRCSRNMTGTKSLFSNFENISNGFVTFGDGNKGKIYGKVTLTMHGLPSLENVIFVQGLKANLISISQICDDRHMMQFSKDVCHVVNKKGHCILIGQRSSDNCYLLMNDLKTKGCDVPT